MRTYIILLTILVLFAGCAKAPANVSDTGFNPQSDSTGNLIVPPIDGYELVWHDEFDYNAVDRTKWNYRDWEAWIGNTMCVPQNVSQSNGLMKIDMILGSYTDPATGKTYDSTAGGLITTERFKFGYYEVSVKLSPVKGWHEAFWGHWTGSNKKTDYFPGWETAPRTEIDCFEHTAEYDNYTVTYGMYEISGLWPNEKSESHHRDAYKGTTDFTSSFNTFGFEYTDEYINYFINGQIIKTVDVRNVGHQYFHLWLTAISTRTPDASGEVLWDYLRCYAPVENSQAYTDRRAHFREVLRQREGESASQGVDLWIEAEDFESLGGWKVVKDEGFTVLSGHSAPPANEADRFATTQITVDQAGTYRLWVRSKDFKTDNPGSRHFQVRINGMIFTGFGKHAGDNLYEWEDGGSVALEQGENTIQIYDSSAYYAKCDKILLTTDMSFRPTGIGGEGNVLP